LVVKEHSIFVGSALIKNHLIAFMPSVTKIIVVIGISGKVCEAAAYIATIEAKKSVDWIHGIIARESTADVDSSS